MIISAILAILTTRGESPKTMREEMEYIRATRKLPSICAGAILDGKVIALESVGVRRIGSEEAVTSSDRYHWGSITKSFTASLVADFVQQGKIRWDETLPELFPDFADQMNPTYRKATVLMLLSHHAGLSGESYTTEMPDWRRLKVSLPDQRWKYTMIALRDKPIAEPGTKFAYSNRDYVVLGCALERLSGKSWEDLLRQELLRPLGMTTASLGAPGWETHTSEPWGHQVERGVLVPIPVGPNADNAEVLGPAGTLNMSVSDMLKWLWFHAQEGRKGGMLEPKTFKVLHTPPFDGDYACGWVARDRSWAGGRALYHNGNNSMNYAVIWIAPAKKFGVAVAINANTPDADNAANAIAGWVIAKYCPGG